MSSDDYSHMNTDDLIQRFIDVANHIGAPLLPWRVKVPLPSDEFDRGAAVIHAIASELRARKPIAQLRARLFDNESLDVQGWAGGQLHLVDPEWAEAACSGVFYDLTTREVLAWRQRILQDPARRPALREMTIEQLIERFVDGCERRYGATRFISEEEGGFPNMKAYNKISGDIYVAAQELNRRNELRALLPWLEHPLVDVRASAARYCLPVATDQCIAALEEVKAHGELPESTCASSTLDIWSQGLYCAFPDDPKDIKL